MIPTRLDTSAMPTNLALLITGAALAIILVVVAGAVVVDYLEKAKKRRARK